MKFAGHKCHFKLPYDHMLVVWDQYGDRRMAAFVCYFMNDDDLDNIIGIVYTPISFKKVPEGYIFEVRDYVLLFNFVDDTFMPVGSDRSPIKDRYENDIDSDKIFMEGFVSLMTAFHELGGEVSERPDLDAKFSSQRARAREAGAACVNYRIITIDPEAERRLRGGDKGGSHASPKWHMRIGHVRHLAGGKTTWVRPCEVGDKARGMVIKDYAVGHE